MRGTDERQEMICDLAVDAYKSMEPVNGHVFRELFTWFKSVTMSITFRFNRTLPDQEEAAARGRGQGGFKARVGLQIEAPKSAEAEGL